MVREDEVKTGNYFMVIADGEQRLCTVLKAPEPGYFIVNTDDKIRLVVKAAELFPVVLNTDWIKKLGFAAGEIVDLWTRSVDGDISVLRNNGGDNGWALMHTLDAQTGKRCKYVHQLQNDFFKVHQKHLVIAAAVS